MCSIAACIYGHDQIWPADLCKDSSVRHQWRQCETEHWALSLRTTTSNRQWVMTNVSQRGRSSSRVSWKSTFHAKFCWLSHSEDRRRESPRSSLAWGIWPNFHVCVQLVSCQILQIYDATWHTNRLQMRRRRNISRPCFSTPWLLWKASGPVGRNGVCLADCLPSIMNNLLTIRGCYRALLCCHAPQPETLSHSLITG